MGLTEIDRGLLERCLQRKPRAWEDFVDRFMGLVVHVVNHSAQARSVRLTPEDRDDLCAEVFLAVIDNDYAVLRNFRGNCSMATYLTVVARRVVVRELLATKGPAPLTQAPTDRGFGNGRPPSVHTSTVAAPEASVEERLADREEVARLLEGLEGTEATVVRMFHLEGRSYREIGQAVDVPENSIGPILSRARQKMRRAGVN